MICQGSVSGETRFHGPRPQTRVSKPLEEGDSYTDVDVLLIGSVNPLLGGEMWTLYGYHLFLLDTLTKTVSNRLISGV